jgi:hypothetical protein
MITPVRVWIVVHQGSPNCLPHFGASPGLGLETVPSMMSRVATSATHPMVAPTWTARYQYGSLYLKRTARIRIASAPSRNTAASTQLSQSRSFQFCQMIFVSP